MPVYSIENFIPVVHPEAYVHPTAVLVGDVHVGAGCYIGPGASLRGDFGRISIGAGANVQDNCVVHTQPGAETLVEIDGHIGHGAVLHGCSIRTNAMVGINAIIMDGVEIGPTSIVGAGAFVKTGFSCPARSLVIGAPARIVRPLTDAEATWKSHATLQYHRLARRCLASLRETRALEEAEPGRPRFSTDGFVSLRESRGV